MISEPRGGSLLYRWTQAAVAGTNTLGNGSGAIVFTPPILVGPDGMQLLVMLNVVQATTNYLARMQLSLDGVNFRNEIVEAANLKSGGAQQYDINIKEWGPTAVSFPIHRPVDFWAFRIGVYSNGAPTAGDDLNVTWAVQGGGQIQGPST